MARPVLVNRMAEKVLSNGIRCYQVEFTNILFSACDTYLMHFTAIMVTLKLLLDNDVEVVHYARSE